MCARRAPGGLHIRPSALASAVVPGAALKHCPSMLPVHSGDLPPRQLPGAHTHAQCLGMRMSQLNALPTLPSLPGSSLELTDVLIGGPPAGASSTFPPFAGVCVWRFTALPADGRAARNPATPMPVVALMSCLTTGWVFASRSRASPSHPVHTCRPVGSGAMAGSGGGGGPASAAGGAARPLPAAHTGLFPGWVAAGCLMGPDNQASCLTAFSSSRS